MSRRAVCDDGLHLSRARLVLSINRDPEAPSMRSCDVGLVANLEEALVALEDGLRSFASGLEVRT